MRALIICGSSRSGNTDAMCSVAAEALSLRGYEVIIRYPSEMSILDCDGCDACMLSGVCRIDDGMFTLYSDYVNSDLIVLASPLRFDGPSSQIKRVMDRFQVFWNNKADHGPKGCLILACGGSGRAYFTHLVAIFDRFCNSMGVDIIGAVTIPGTDGMEHHDVAKATEEQLEGILGCLPALSSSGNRRRGNRRKGCWRDTHRASIPIRRCRGNHPYPVRMPCRILR